MQKKKISILLMLILILGLSACSFGAKKQDQAETTIAEESEEAGTETLPSGNSGEQTAWDAKEASNESSAAALPDDLPEIVPGQVAEEISRFTDENGDTAYIRQNSRCRMKKASR